jgi:HD-like signal output (HDOD) protein
VFSSFDAAAIQGISVAGVWRHSLAVGALARRIAMSEDADETLVEDAFMAGMLHDVGTLVLAASLPSGYERAPALVAAERVDHREAERRIFGVTHPRVGAYLIGIWGMADEIVEAVAYHHEPLRCPDRTFSALTAVHVGNALDGSSGGPDLAYLETLGLAGRFEDWRRLTATAPEEAPA